VLGLIYKDLVHSKIMTAAFLANLIIGSVFILQGEAVIAVIYTYMMFLFGSMIPDMAFSMDFMAKWNVYAACLPTVRKTVTARYALMLSVYGVCLLFTAGSAAISKTGLDVYSVIVFFAFITAFDAISYVFYYRFGVKRGGAFKLLFIALIPIAFIMYLLFGDLSVFGSEGFLSLIDWVDNLGFTGIAKKIWLPSLIIAAVVTAASIRVSQALIKRRGFIFLNQP